MIRQNPSASLTREDALLLATLIAVMVFLQIPWSPPNHKVETDVTVYSYGGQEILRGQLPYQDFWDNKPPGVFYFYAAAFWLLGSDAWSVWYLTTFWTALILTIFYLFLREILVKKHAFAGTALLLGILLRGGFYQGAATPEFIGILPAIGSLVLALAYFRSPRWTVLLWLGLMLAVEVLLKPTNIATTTACIIAILTYKVTQGELRAAVRSIVVVCIPPAMFLMLVMGYWSWNGALLDLWQATIIYNLIHFEGGFTLRSVYAVARTFTTDPSLLFLVALALGTAITLLKSWTLLFTRRPDLNSAEALSSHSLSWAYAAFIAALPLEVLFIASTGKDFGHYYQSAFPALCASAGFWLRSRTTFPPETSGGRLTPRASNLVLGILAAWGFGMIGFLRPSMSDLSAFWRDAPGRVPRRTEIGQFITRATRPTDTVLVWSIGAGLNFETHRRSPTRYVYDHPLLQEGFQNASRWHEFLAGLRKNPPALIIVDTRHEFAPDLSVPDDQLAQACGCSGAILDGFRSFSRFVKTHYTATRTFAEHLVVYEKQAQ